MAGHGMECGGKGAARHTALAVCGGSMESYQPSYIM